VYTGHIGIALALGAERDAPPLWLLALAAQGPDWGDAVHELLRRPYGNLGWSSHSFPLVGFGALGAALLAYALTRRHRAALLAALAYLSHWPADYFTGLKPTWPGGPLVGLQWYTVPGRDLVLESVVVIGGWWLWRRSLPAPATRSRGLAFALLAALLLLQLAADVVMAHGTLLS